MARASAKRGRRPRANARASAPVTQPEPSPPVREKPAKPEPKATSQTTVPKERSFRLRRKPKAAPRPEDQMFFTRLRTHAKWMFVFLALAFGIGFVAFGVGAGGTGIGDAIQDFFSGDDTPSLEEARANVSENPGDPQALLELANVLQGQQQFGEAASTLEQYLELQPGDVDVLRQLAAVYASRAQQISVEQAVLGTAGGPEGFSSSVYAFPESSGFLGAVGQNPIVDARTTQVQAESNELGDRLDAVYQDQIAVYERIAELTPDDPQVFLELGEAATAGRDSEAAIAAYERFLELDPESPLANSIKEQIDLLESDVFVERG